MVLSNYNKNTAKAIALKTNKPSEIHLGEKRLHISCFLTLSCSFQSLQYSVHGMLRRNTELKALLHTANTLVESTVRTCCICTVVTNS